MLTVQQMLLLALAALPYIGVLAWLLISHRTKEFSLSGVFLGLFDIVIALGAGVVALLIIIGSFPQTNSTLTNSFLVGVFAAMMGVALVVGEFFRYMILKPNEKEEKSPLAGLSFGVGVSLGEYIFFVVMTVMNQDYTITIDMTLMLLADILIQLGISVVAYELIRQNNFAFIAVGGLYYLSMFLLMVLNTSTVLTVAAKVIVLGIVIALFIAYLPGKKRSREGSLS